MKDIATDDPTYLSKTMYCSPMNPSQLDSVDYPPVINGDYSIPDAGLHQFVYVDCMPGYQCSSTETQCAVAQCTKDNWEQIVDSIPTCESMRICVA